MASVPTWSGPLITPRQQRLLFAMVEWERAGEDPEFVLFEILRRRTVFNNHNELPVLRSDVEQLGTKNYFHVRRYLGDVGDLFASLTAEAHAYYEAHQGAHHPAEQLAEQIRTYVDTSAMSFCPEADAHTEGPPCHSDEYEFRDGGRDAVDGHVKSDSWSVERVSGQ